VRTLPYNVHSSTLTSGSAISSTNLSMRLHDVYFVFCRLIKRLRRILASLCMIFLTSSSLKTSSHVGIRMLWRMHASHAAWMSP